MIKDFIIDANKTILAFDYGTCKTGVALGMASHVRPLEIINTHRGLPDTNRLDKLIDQWQPDGFVVGLPTGENLQQIADKATAFANWLEKHYSRPAELVDESYSSCIIENVHGKARDHISALLLLRQWYQQQKSRSSIKDRPTQYRTVTSLTQ